MQINKPWKMQQVLFVSRITRPTFFVIRSRSIVICKFKNINRNWRQQLTFPQANDPSPLIGCCGIITTPQTKVPRIFFFGLGSDLSQIRCKQSRLCHLSAITTCNGTLHITMSTILHSVEFGKTSLVQSTVIFYLEFQWWMVGFCA